MKSCIFHIFLLYIFHNVVFKSVQDAITKKKSMLDNYKRNVLPGASYPNITFLLTTVKRKRLITWKGQQSLCLASYVAFSTALSILLSEGNLKAHCTLCHESLCLCLPAFFPGSAVTVRWIYLTVRFNILSLAILLDDESACMAWRNICAPTPSRPASTNQRPPFQTWYMLGEGCSIPQLQAGQWRACVHVYLKGHSLLQNMS